MKKQVIVDLIRYHVEGNESGFRTLAYEIANEFDRTGDREISQFIQFQLSGDAWVPQVGTEFPLPRFWRQLDKPDEHPLMMPEVIVDEMRNIIKAVIEKTGLTKFLFVGASGTGKTETAKQLARILNRDLYALDFKELLTCGEIESDRIFPQAFRPMHENSLGEKVVFLFDRFEALETDSAEAFTKREREALKASFRNCLEGLPNDVIVIAETKRRNVLRKEIVEQFDAVVDFNRYEDDDLMAVADKLLAFYGERFKLPQPDLKLFHKVLALIKPRPRPSNLKNYIKWNLTLCNHEETNGFIRSLCQSVLNRNQLTILELSTLGFTVREIEAITGVSKSKVARDLKSARDGQVG